VLSQFSRKLKKTPANGEDSDEGADPVELDIERQLDMFEDEISGPGVGDEELIVEDNEDEIAGDVAASNALAVDEVIREAGLSIRLDALPAAQANIGRVCIAKVSYWVMQMTCY
jgi:hypothetical protein